MKQNNLIGPLKEDWNIEHIAPYYKVKLIDYIAVCLIAVVVNALGAGKKQINMRGCSYT